MRTLGQVLAALTDYKIVGDEPPIGEVVIDSRLATADSLFLAFAGQRADGHSYAAEAFANGAVAVLAEKPVAACRTLLDLRQSPPAAGAQLEPPVCILVEDTLLALQQLATWWRSQFDVQVVGISGSVGKTTTKEVTHQVLSQGYHTLKSPGNYNNEIGLPLTLLALEADHDRAVLEMGMYERGEIRQLCDIAQPHIGVMTMIGPVHLERLGSMEAIVKAKRELIEALPPDGTAILNSDDERVMSMAAHTRARVFTYGLDQSADMWADSIHSMGLEGIHFTLHHGRDSLNVHLPLLGRHSVHTALRAAAVGIVDGLSWPEIVNGLGQATDQLRLVAVTGPRGSVLVDDTYNSSPDSALAALNLLHDLDGRRIAVLGDMLELGAVSEQAHRIVGRRAADVVDILITIGTLGQVIGSEAAAVGMDPARLHHCEASPAAIPLLRDLIQQDDVVLIKGSQALHMDEIVAELSEG